jgi:hypothetical protein
MPLELSLRPSDPVRAPERLRYGFVETVGRLPFQCPEVRHQVGIRSQQRCDKAANPRDGDDRPGHGAPASPRRERSQFRPRDDGRTQGVPLNPMPSQVRATASRCTWRGSFLPSVSSEDSSRASAEPEGYSRAVAVGPTSYWWVKNEASTTCPGVLADLTLDTGGPTIGGSLSLAVDRWSQAGGIERGSRWTGRSSKSSSGSRSCSFF